MKDIAVITIGIEEFKEIINNIIDCKLTPLLEQSSQVSEENAELITRQELAKKLHISLPTLAELTKSGAIKGYRIRRRILYNWYEVKNDLQQINYQKYHRKDLK